MNEDQSNSGGSAYIARLKQARRSVTVLKLQLASLRARLPLIPVFAFEGGDDKIVYYSWVRRVRQDLDYEPFPCSGKRQVFQFREMLYRDLGGLDRNVYFFVDRDFDDMQGNAPDERTFMTDYYSTDNYLVCEAVLVEFLKNEFHCHARPDVRLSVIALFARVYSEFISITKKINQRLYVGKQANIELASSVPQRINEIATVSLDRVTSPAKTSEELVRFKSQPSPDLENNSVAEFDSLDGRTRYRGKFAYLFFERWLQLLGEERGNANSALFGSVEDKSRVKYQEIVRSNFASKSPMPRGLPEFLMRVA